MTETPVSFTQWELGCSAREERRLEELEAVHHGGAWRGVCGIQEEAAVYNWSI